MFKEMRTMHNSLDTPKLGNPLISISLFTSVVITLFFFYIDEGYYSFAWMLEPGAWIIFAVYVFIFFSVQVFLFGFFYNILPNLFKGKLVIPSLGIISLIGAVCAGLIVFLLFKTL